MSEYYRPYPVPTEVDYQAAAETEQLQLQEDGGAWTSYYKEAIIETERHASTRSVFEALSATARLVEPILNDNHTPIDNLFKATHAFRAGMWSGARISNHIHEGRVRYEDVHNTLNQSLPYKVYDGQDEYESNGRHLLNTGEAGLQIVGYEARQHLNEWSSDIVSAPDVRQYYSLGAGAILFTSHSIYSTVYPTLIENFNNMQSFKQTDD